MGDNENTPHALDAELAVARLRAHGFSAEAAVLVGRSDAAWNMLRALRDALRRTDPAWCKLHRAAGGEAVSDREHITLPREVVQDALDALEFAERHNGGDDCYADSITALRTALAAPRLEVTVDPRLTAEEAAAILAALAAEQPKPEPKPVAWVQKWAIARLTGQMGAVSEPVTWGIDAPLFTCEVHHSVPLYTAPPEDEALRQDAERYRWMKQEVKRIPPSWGLIGWDAAIDAAMENKR